jgi:hypothetical protein
MAYFGRSPSLTVIVERADGLKCPRCWRFFGIRDNPQGLCDRCCGVLLQSKADEFGVDAVLYAELLDQIRDSRKRQVAHYGAKCHT